MKNLGRVNKINFDWCHVFVCNTEICIQLIFNYKFILVDIQENVLLQNNLEMMAGKKKKKRFEKNTNNMGGCGQLKKL